VTPVQRGRQIEPRQLLDHRLVLLTGKGGVGKTTVAAALAVDAARRGGRPLLVELGHRASMRSVFEVAEVGFVPRPVGHGVSAMSIDLDLAVIDYIATVVPSHRLARAIARNRVLERLFAAMPAVGEIATLHALHRRLEEMDGTSPRWSPVIVDLDATGHALMFLELRQAVGGLIGAGPMRRLVDHVADLIADPAQCRLCLVTLPDELPVTETLELHARLSASGSVAFGPTFVNRVPGVELAGESVARLAALRSLVQGAPDLLADVAFAEERRVAHERAEAQVARLRASVPGDVVELPELGGARLSAEELIALAAIATGGPS
jgi:arsenite/tail-anchored protein-transporting ATPase